MHATRRQRYAPTKSRKSTRARVRPALLTQDAQARTIHAQARFPGAFAQTANVAAAARAAKIDRSTVYYWLKDHETFHKLYDQALEEAVDGAEAEAWRRAVKGTT